MSLKKVKNNLEINGVEYDIWYDPDSGSVQVRTDVGVFGKQGDLIYDSKVNKQNSVFEEAIKKDSKTVNNIKKSKNSDGGKGKQPGFITDSSVKSGFDAIQDRIKEEFKLVPQDYFFNGGSAKYPEDAIYDKTREDAQDHLVISQYSYKAPRADKIWGQKGTNAGDILINGVGRQSALDKFLGLVQLPMPNNITDSNNVRWGEDTMNAIEAAALAVTSDGFGDDALTALIGGVGGIASGGDALETASQTVAAKNAVEAINQARKTGDLNKSILGPELQARILAAMNIESSAESILARRDGVIPNSNLELLFSAPTLRQFSFMYKLSPRSASEAKIVNGILRFFKQGMAAKKRNQYSGGIEGDGQSYFLGTPNVFRLQYRTSGGKEIEGLNRIKTCALTGTSVNYTPEGAFASYDGGQPVSVILTLGFQELEPIYDTDYKFTGGKGERGDSDSGEGYRWAISENEVGY